ncbi:MAG TPA: hypothetical protein VK642_14590, partial [Burkholderiales bacterium]|nr:hypothetical protein [Burkholderiales bacterium]
RLYRTLQTTFSNFLKKHGFKLSAEPKSGNELDFWFVTFRSEFFDLSIGGRGGIGVYGRPRYCQEDWYSIPLVFALLDGVNHIVTGNDDLDRLAQAMDERHAELGHFFSPQGNDTRLEFAQWTEKEYWRMWGRDDVPKDAA